MRRRLLADLLPLSLFALAFWPVLRWYALRIGDAGDDRFGVVAVVAFVVLSWRRSVEGELGIRLPLVGAAMMAAYAVLYGFVTPLPRAALAVTAIAAWVSRRSRNRVLDPGLLALGLLALPLITSLQFYAGYPLRLAAASIAAGLLQSSGFAVVRAGVLLDWGGRMIAVDAPCSGVRMLWTAWFLVALMVARSATPWRFAVPLFLFATAAVVLGNALRAVLLFLPETGLMAMPDGYHGAIGVVVFVMVTASIVAVASKREQSCCA
jgi:exosortase/archaeosortase family protein